VTFKLSSADNKSLIDNQTVTLNEHAKKRRLNDEMAAASSSSSSSEQRNCDEFFLLDGRDPVELPDTWSEARDSFLQLCESESSDAPDACLRSELEAFAGYPERSEEPFLADEKLCNRLMYHAPGIDKEALALFLNSGVLPRGAVPRRTKGSTSSGGAATSSHTSKNAGAGTYTYSTARMTTMYPAGYATTGYGFSGYTSRMPSRVIGTYFIVGWWGPRMFWGSRRYTHCHDGSGQACDSSSAVKCETGEDCDWKAISGDNLIRDDLMQTGFKPINHKGPFTLTISKIDGAGFNTSRICPPSGWTPTGASSGSWTPPAGQDLFAALSNAEGFVEEEEINHWVWVGPLLAVFFCCCLGCIILKNKKPNGKNDIFKEVQEHRTKMQGDNSDGVIPKEFVLTGANCQYTLQVASDGSITGESTWHANSFTVEGVVLYFPTHNCGTIFWCETQGALSREVQASIQRNESGFSLSGQVYTALNGVWDEMTQQISLLSSANPVEEFASMDNAPPRPPSTVVNAVVIGVPLTNHAAPAGGLTNVASLTNHATPLPGQVRTSEKATE